MMRARMPQARCQAAASARIPVRLALSWRARLKGLLGTRASSEALLLAPCKSIHTFGMRYPIHVAFIDRRGVVVKSLASVKPGRMASCREAACVLELASREVGEWLRVGERIYLQCACEGASRKEES